MNFYEILADQAVKYSDKALFITDDEICTYGQMLAQVDERAADWQAAAGTVQLVRQNSTWEQLIGWLAFLKVKAYPILCHTDLEEERFQLMVEKYHLQDCDPGIPDKADFGVLSSGSTGIPKVLWRSCRSWLDFFPVQNQIFEVTPDTVIFIHGSASFTGNLNTLLSVLYAGGTIVTSDRFRPAHWIELCRRYAVNTIYVLPAKLRLILRNLTAAWEQITMIFTGSQMLDEALMDELRNRLPAARFILYYGASELNYISWCTYDEWLQEPNTVGRAFPGVTITVRDGLVYVDTPYGIEGIELPYSAGDKGHFSPSGMLMFEGRRDSMINRGGYKIFIPALEQSLQRLPSVEEAVAAAYEDELRGEVPVAYIVLQKGCTLADVQEDIRRSIGVMERPRHVVPVSYIPLNSRSKTDQAALQEKLEEFLKLKRR